MHKVTRSNLRIPILKTLVLNYSTFHTGRLIINPSSSDVTKTCVIRGEGFAPKTPLTIQGTLKCPSEDLDFQSFAHIHTCDVGKFDLSTTESVGGTYAGVDGMGLFWSMEKQGNSFGRLQLNNGLTNLRYRFQVFEGHVNIFSGNEICTGECVRYFVNRNVSRIPVKNGNVVGTLFEPSGEGPFPGLIILHGGNKRNQIIEDIAAMLSGQGFATIALAYFGIQGLPKSYTNTPLEIEYFEEAINYLSSREKVDSKSLGVYGISKGGDIALAMMSHLPQVKAVCSINGSICSMGATTTYKGFSTEMLTVDIGKVKLLEDGSLNVLDVLTNPRQQPASIHQFERSSSDLLMIAGLDDYNWRSDIMADIAQERMVAAGKCNYNILKLPGMGHLVDAPYMPVCTQFSHVVAPKGKIVYFGGKNKAQHTTSQVHAWNEIFSFFKKSFQ